MISLSNRTLTSSLLLEQKSRKQRLTHEMMAARLCLVVDATNTGKRFFTCKPDRKTKEKLISVSQSIVFHFLQQCRHNWEIKGFWENNVIILGITVSTSPSPPQKHHPLFLAKLPLKSEICPTPPSFFGNSPPLYWFFIIPPPPLPPSLKIGFFILNPILSFKSN